jgi:hypothetical protein
MYFQHNRTTSCGGVPERAVPRCLSRDGQQELAAAATELHSYTFSYMKDMKSNGSKAQRREEHFT